MVINLRCPFLPFLNKTFPNLPLHNRSVWNAKTLLYPLFLFDCVGIHKALIANCKTLFEMLFHRSIILVKLTTLLRNSFERKVSYSLMQKMGVTLHLRMLEGRWKVEMYLPLVSNKFQLFAKLTVEKSKYSNHKIDMNLFFKHLKLSLNICREVIYLKSFFLVDFRRN